MKNKINLTLLFLGLLSCSRLTDRANIHSWKIRSLSNFDVSDYKYSNLYDTRIYFNKNHLLIFNYEVGHSDFYASDGSMQLIKNGKEIFRKTINLKGVQQNMSSPLSPIIQKLKLNSFPLTFFYRPKSYIKKDGMNYAIQYKNGVTHLKISSNKLFIDTIISRESLQSTPGIQLKDLNADGANEIIIFFNWEALSFWEMEMEKKCFIYSLVKT
ncbi:MAG: hypothetical protein ACKOXP_09860 [Flavobacteriales bacterium]